MQRKHIYFPEINRAALFTEEMPTPGPGDVTVHTVYSTVSPGTERANITGDPKSAARQAHRWSFRAIPAILPPASWRRSVTTSQA